MSQRPAAGLMIFWDYDTQWGGDRSRAGEGRRDWGALEFPNTERLLEVHTAHGVPACFAVVGAAALPGERPYHDPAQIRRIHAAGNEVGSHSFRHEWIPGLTQAELHRTIKNSKDSLEQCVGHRVTAFVPPYNQPFHYPGRLAFSLSEYREAGRNHISLPGMCQALVENGFEFCRIAYRPIWKHLIERVSGRRLTGPASVEKIAGVQCVQINTPCGFDARSKAMLDRSIEEGGLTIAYGHPHSLFMGGSQDLKFLDPFLAYAAGHIRSGRLRAVLPRDIVNSSGVLPTVEASQMTGAERR
jgi:Polysaccharide deacetylase